MTRFRELENVIFRIISVIISDVLTSFTAKISLFLLFKSVLFYVFFRKIVSLKVIDILCKEWYYTASKSRTVGVKEGYFVYHANSPFVIIKKQAANENVCGLKNESGRGRRIRTLGTRFWRYLPILHFNRT